MMDNLRGSLFMILAMGLFAVEDMLIKQMSVQLSTGQIFIFLGLGGVASFAAISRLQGHAILTPLLWHPVVLMRTLAEVIGSVGFVTALSLIDISSASAILQAVPLVVTLGAALFLGETVGWRRWLAIAVGLIGVLLIIRPGAETFQPASMFAVLGAVGLAARDVLTRLAPPDVSSNTFSIMAFLAFVPTGAFLMWLSADAMVQPNAINILRLIASVVIGVLAYLAIITATRTGEVATVAPFRYSRIVFALIVGYFVFDETPDALMLIGTAIVVGSGLYTLWRETRVKRASTSIPVDPAL